MCKHGEVRVISCYSRTAWTLTLAASIVGEEISLRNGLDGYVRPPESFLALFTGWKYLTMTWLKSHMINNTGTWLTETWNWESWKDLLSFHRVLHALLRIYGHIRIVNVLLLYTSCNIRASNGIIARCCMKLVL